MSRFPAICSHGFRLFRFSGRVMRLLPPPFPATFFSRPWSRLLEIISLLFLRNAKALNQSGKTPRGNEDVKMQRRPKCESTTEHAVRPTCNSPPRCAPPLPFSASHQADTSAAFPPYSPIMLRTVTSRSPGRSSSATSSADAMVASGPALGWARQACDPRSAWWYTSAALVVVAREHDAVPCRGRAARRSADRVLARRGPAARRRGCAPGESIVAAPRTPPRGLLALAFFVRVVRGAVVREEGRVGAHAGVLVQGHVRQQHERRAPRPDGVQRASMTALANSNVSRCRS